MGPTLSSHPAPRNPAPHRVSWVEGPLSSEAHHSGPALASLGEEEEEEEETDHYKDEEQGPEDVLTSHVQALARSRSSYVARQFRGLKARLTSDAGGPQRPGDPATELLQDVRHFLTDLQDHLAKDPSVRAVVGSRGSGVPQKDEDLGNEEGGEETCGHSLNPRCSHLPALGPTYVFTRQFFLSIPVHAFSTHAPFPTPSNPYSVHRSVSHRRDSPDSLSHTRVHAQGPSSTHVHTHVFTYGRPEAREGWQ